MARGPLVMSAFPVKLLGVGARGFRFLSQEFHLGQPVTGGEGPLHPKGGNVPLPRNVGWLAVKGQLLWRLVTLQNTASTWVSQCVL